MAGQAPKRPFSIPSRAPLGAKKPLKVKDLFDNSDDEGEQRRAKQPKTAPQQSAPPPPQPAAAPRRDAGITAEAKDVADKLAGFVAKNGRHYEDLTRDKNPGDTPFKFLREPSSATYLYYSAKLRELEAAAGQGPSTSAPWPAAALPYARPPGPPAASAPGPSPSGAPSSWAPRPKSREEQLDDDRFAHLAAHRGDSISAMEAFTAAAARRERSRQEREDEEAEERRRQQPLLNETAFDRRKVVSVYKNDGSRGHHMQDFIPEEELAKFLAKSGDAYGAKKAAELEERSKIGADNIGHKLLQKMGWKEGDALGGSQKGITAPVKAAGAADSLGLGAAAHGEVSADDDPYEAYRKRMMLGYKYRPNPLGNPRKAYY